MVARVRSVAFHGISVQDVDVEVHIANGLLAFQIVGLPDKAVAESKERVRSALHALGLALPPKRLTVNLAPADLSKEGSHFDLPIALGILMAMDVVPADELENSLVLGELSLDARLRRVHGVLPAAVHAVANDNRLICPASCGQEAAWAGEGLDIIAPQDLLQFINHMKGTQVLGRPSCIPLAGNGQEHKYADLSTVRGQETAKRALEVAAAGGHNMLMSGPPGSGKSMLASFMPGILPPLSPAEALSVSMIHSIAGVLPEGGLLTERPFRAPHHSASLPALVGGGHKVKPGEISLAHHGVLFLDELPEFQRGVLESMRQPLETGEVMIARANHHVTYPAQFQLIVAMNPCRCGYLGDAARECTKAPRCGSDYRSRISGPLLDRIDICIDVPEVPFEKLTAVTQEAEPSSAVAARVARAREIQSVRFASYNRDFDRNVNAAIPPDLLDDMVKMTAKARGILYKAAEKHRLSARGYHRLMRVARTLADLSGNPGEIEPIHVAESINYKQFV